MRDFAVGFLLGVFTTLALSLAVMALELWRTPKQVLPTPLFNPRVLPPEVSVWVVACGGQQTLCDSPEAAAEIARQHWLARGSKLITVTPVRCPDFIEGD